MLYEEAVFSLWGDCSNARHRRDNRAGQGDFREDAASTATLPFRLHPCATPRDGLGTWLLQVVRRTILLEAGRVGGSAAPGRCLGCTQVAPGAWWLHFCCRSLARR